MRPVAIVQHESHVAPGYFADWLRAQSIPQRLIRIFAGEAVPRDPREFAGLCFMGGTMSVNDPLPWIDEALALIRAADAAAVPVIGHCLGGQLIAKALGAQVSRNPVQEIGWRRLRVVDARVARNWLGTDAPEIEMFQWHGETFDLPAGARNFLASELCAHQAYVIERDGFAHLGMQFHCEMTPALVRDWINQPEAERPVDGDRGPGVQAPVEMLRDVAARSGRMNALAARLYARWWAGAQRSQRTSRAAA